MTDSHLGGGEVRFSLQIELPSCSEGPGHVSLADIKISRHLHTHNLSLVIGQAEDLGAVPVAGEGRGVPGPGGGAPGSNVLAGGDVRHHHVDILTFHLHLHLVFPGQRRR